MLDKSDIEVRILRSDRRSVVGKVLPNGSIEVRAPLSMTTEAINRFLDKWEPKYLPLVTQCREAKEAMSKHPFGYGGEVLFKGEWTPVKQAEDNNGGYMALYKNGEIVVYPGLSDKKMCYHVEDLLSNLAIPIFEKKLHYYMDIMDVRCKTWTIGNARNRHGSCDSNGKIILSWRIVMFPEAVMDYVIVHELAHLKHMNHAKAFKSEVAAVLPDWKERQKTQVDYSLMLRCDGWT
jgi:predicted metal-dependent hydrolase